MRDFIKYCLLLILVFLFACESPNDPVVEGEPYMSLNIGDVRQYYSNQQGLWYDIEILDTLRRTDGKLIHAIRERFLVSNSIVFWGIDYYYIEDNFLISTRPDTVFTPYYIESNPFDESRVIQIHPKESNTYINNEAYPDSLKVFISSELIDSVETRIKTYKNVQKCTSVQTDIYGDENTVVLYYAPKYGHIKTEITMPFGMEEVSLTYYNLFGEEAGDYITFPEDNMVTYKKLNTAEKNKMLKNIFGAN